MIGVNVSQFMSLQLGRFGHGTRLGGERLIVIGTWSEPVEEREASHPLNIGRRRGLAKDRSITEGRAHPTKGNLVYYPWGLRRAKLASAALSK